MSRSSASWADVVLAVMVRLLGLVSSLVWPARTPPPRRGADRSGLVAAAKDEYEPHKAFDHNPPGCAVSACGQPSRISRCDRAPIETESAGGPGRVRMSGACRAARPGPVRRDRGAGGRSRGAGGLWVLARRRVPPGRERPT